MSSDPSGSPEPGAMVMVTGASGFIGLNLLHVLASDRRPVVGLADRPLPHLAAASLAQLGPVPVVDQVDVRDTDAVAKAVGRHQPGVVIHAAAVTAGPDRERTDAGTVVDINIGGTQSVLDACSRVGVKRLVHVSSGAVYGSATFGPEALDETTLVAPASPPLSYYGITKLAAEQLARRHGQLHDLDVVAARLSAAFGPWEYPSGVRDFMSPMLQMVRAARDGTPIRLLVDQPRNWVYAPDAARALVGLADLQGPEHDCYNVCPEATTTAAAFLDRLARSHPELDHALVDRPETATIGCDTDPRLARAAVSSRRLARELGPAWGEALWTAADQAFDDYIRWAKANPSWL